MRAADLDPADLLVIRHSWVPTQAESGVSGISPQSSDGETLAYTQRQSKDLCRFPSKPGRFWIVFPKEYGNRTRLWSVLENCGELPTDHSDRAFSLAMTNHLEYLRGRLVIGWLQSEGYISSPPSLTGVTKSARQPAQRVFARGGARMQPLFTSRIKIKTRSTGA